MATDPADELKPTTSAKPAAPKAKASDAKTTSAQAKDMAAQDGTAKASKPKAADPAKVGKDGKDKGKGKGKADRRKPVRLDSPRWLAPVMVASFIIGLVWIVAYYIAPEAPFISTLGWWNVLVGFGFFAVGFVLSTKWK